MSTKPKLLQMIYLKYTFLVSYVFIFFGSCKIDNFLTLKGAYQKYVEALSKNEFGNTVLALDWIKVGQSVMKDSIVVDLPYTELTRFDPAEPNAAFLRYKVKEGQNIEIQIKRISSDGDDDAKIFINTFTVHKNEFKALKEEAETDSLAYKVEKDAEHAVRIQSELLKGGLIQIHIRYTASLAFPLPDRTHESIDSFYGDGRDAGRRKHEGVDIFAPRGTPVLAVVPGLVTKVKQNQLGGKVIYVSGGGYSYYYAHLDSQMVNAGQKVKIGDVIGLVGNTGNASRTHPHLHFGIYSLRRGALNPFHFFAMPKLADNTVLTDTVPPGNYYRIKNNRVNLRSRPDTRSIIIKKLDKNEILKVEASLINWYRVKLPDGKVAFIHKSLCEKAESSLRSISLSATDRLKDKFSTEDTYDANLVDNTVEILGSYDNFYMIRLKGGNIAWLQKKS